MKRIEWIDALKGIGIIYVIFAHLSPELLIETHIYSFHMFLFFFISGCLYKEKKNETMETFGKKRIKRLLIPFAFWNILAVLIEFLLNSNYTMRGALFDLFFLDGKISWNAPIWFLVVLFEVEVLYRAIRRVNNNRVRHLLLIIIFILGIFTQETNLPFGISIVPIASSFYYLGSLSYRSNIIEKLYQLNNLKLFFIGTSLLIINIYFSVVLNIRISVLNSYYGNYLFAYIAGITGIFLYLIIAMKLEKNKFLSYFGKNTLFLLSVQYFFFRFFESVSLSLYNFNVWHDRGTIKALIFTFIVLIISYVIIELLIKSKNKYIETIRIYMGIGSKKSITNYN